MSISYESTYQYSRSQKESSKSDSELNTNLVFSNRYFDAIAGTQNRTFQDLRCYTLLRTIVVKELENVFFKGKLATRVVYEDSNLFQPDLLTIANEYTNRDVEFVNYDSSELYSADENSAVKQYIMNKTYEFLCCENGEEYLAPFSDKSFDYDEYVENVKSMIESFILFAIYDGSIEDKELSVFDIYNSYVLRTRQYPLPLTKLTSQIEFPITKSLLERNEKRSNTMTIGDNGVELINEFLLCFTRKIVEIFERLYQALEKEVPKRLNVDSLTFIIQILIPKNLFTSANKRGSHMYAWYEMGKKLSDSSFVNPGMFADYFDNQSCFYFSGVCQFLIDCIITDAEKSAKKMNIKGEKNNIYSLNVVSALLEEDNYFILFNNVGMDITTISVTRFFEYHFIKFLNRIPPSHVVDVSNIKFKHRITEFKLENKDSIERSYIPDENPICIDDFPFYENSDMIEEKEEKEFLLTYNDYTPDGTYEYVPYEEPDESEVIFASFKRNLTGSMSTCFNAAREEFEDLEDQGENPIFTFKELLTGRILSSLDDIFDEYE